MTVAAETGAKEEMMDTEKRVILERLMLDFLADDDVSAGDDGYISDALFTRMTDAAEAVYDASMEIQGFMKREGYEV